MEQQPQRLVKSNERVRDLAEVFTPAATVAEMLDLLPSETWCVHPAATFLEPACGDGNFLAAVLERKLSRVQEAAGRSELPAGTTQGAVLFHALEALASIYAADISVDNIVGGVPGHERGARTRLLDRLAEWHAGVLGKRLAVRSPAMKAASWIVEHNVLVGNMLPADVAGRPTGREGLPLIEYRFDPATQGVTLLRTTMGDVLASAHLAASGELSLFQPPPAALLWSGPALDLFAADRVESPELRGPAKNGVQGRST